MSEEYYCYAGQPDQPIHTPDHLFCDDMSCPCHEDEDNMATLAGWHEDGLIGAVDGELIYTGRTI